MSDFLDFLRRLDEAQKKYTKKELTPVIIQKPEKGSGGSPPPMPDKPPEGMDPNDVEIEVHNVGGEQPEEKPGKAQKGPKATVKDIDKPTSDKETGEDGEEDGKQQAGEDGKEDSKQQPGEDGEKDSKQQPGEDGKPGKSGAEDVNVQVKTPSPGEAVSKKKERRKKPKRTSWDSHDILEKSQKGEAKEIAEKIYQEAEERRRKDELAGKEPGHAEGHFADKIRGIYESKVDWVKELKKILQGLRMSMSKSFDKLKREFSKKYQQGAGKVKDKSYLQWLRDPRSHAPGQKMIFKGPYVKAPESEVVLIVALDTSGSITNDTVEKVFGELDKIAKNFQGGMSTGGTKLKGRIYFMTWDTVVHQVDDYKTGFWKKYYSGEKKVAGQGGTDVTSVFKYINDHVFYDPEVTTAAAVLNLKKKPSEFAMSQDDIPLPVEKERVAVSPILVIATDGYFSKPTDKDLGTVFGANPESVIWLIIDGTDDNCYPDDHIIKYDSVRI